MAPFRVLSNLFGGNNSITMRNGHMAENTGNRPPLGDSSTRTQNGAGCSSEHPAPSVTGSARDHQADGTGGGTTVGRSLHVIAFGT